MNIHRNARTTPKIREEIHASKGHMTIDEAVKHFNVSRNTIIKWRQREDFNDKSHRPNNLNTALLPVQEAIIVELRRSLLLTLDDLLVVSREFVDPTLSRSSLLRLLKRHGVNQLSQLYEEQSENTESKKPKTFKDYEPGYLHVDIKYLPNMPDDAQKRYLLVGIDRATRWVYMEIVTDKTAKTAAKFIKTLTTKCPVAVTVILTDNELPSLSTDLEPKEIPASSPEALHYIRHLRIKKSAYHSIQRSRLTGLNELNTALLINSHGRRTLSIGSFSRPNGRKSYVPWLNS
jgi:transposase